MATRQLRGAYREVWVEAAPATGAVSIQTSIPISSPAELSRVWARVVVDIQVGNPLVSNPTFAISPNGFLIVNFGIGPPGNLVAYTLEVQLNHSIQQKRDPSYGGLGQVFGVSSGGGGSVGLGTRVFIAGAGCTYATVQAAVNAAEAAGPSDANPCMVFVMPGFWNEDVLVRRNGVHFQGLGGQGVVILNSLTFSECTLASIAAFNASGNPALLVLDPALVDPPWRNEVRDIECERRNALSPWVGFANASFRCLSRGNVTGGRVGRNEILSWRCTFRNAVGGGKAIALSYTQYISFYESWCNGDLEARQFAGLWADDSDINGTITLTYDSTLPKASGGNLGLNGRASRFGALVLNGRDAKIGVDYMLKCGFASVVNNCTNAASTSVFDDCFVKGAFTITNVGPLVTYNAGRYMVAVNGAGAAGFTGVPGFNS